MLRSSPRAGLHEAVTCFKGPAAGRGRCRDGTGSGCIEAEAFGRRAVHEVPISGTLAQAIGNAQSSPSGLQRRCPDVVDPVCLTMPSDGWATKWPGGRATAGTGAGTGAGTMVRSALGSPRLGWHHVPIARGQVDSQHPFGGGVAVGDPIVRGTISVYSPETRIRVEEFEQAIADQERKKRKLTF